jgi:inositol transport system substrate-binding protein
MDFTVLQSAKGQGERAVEAISIMANGGSISSVEGVTENGKYVWVPFEKVDASNVSSYQ